jgi:hypothetical protein
MSWDLMLLPFRPEWSSAKDIPDDWMPGPLGPRSSVVAAIAEVFPQATERDDGMYSIGGDTVDILVGLEDPTESVNVHVYGGATPLIMERLITFASRSGTRALDIQTGAFLTSLGDAEASYAAWQAWLETILDSESGESTDDV